MTDPAVVYESIRDEMGEVLIGNEVAVERLVTALLTRGHLLVEGIPGVAKTTIARLFSQATGLEYNRIQMTPDILPADITGTYVYREQTGEFSLRKGPVFANIVVADEINRVTPKTQSALLEAMQERRVTIEGKTHDLPEPFLVIATQNPIEMEGTFELPEAQRDRFQMKHAIGLPSREEETELLDRFDANLTLGAEDIGQVTAPADLLDAREFVSKVHVSPEVKSYILDVATATRESPDVEYGASPRASIAFLNSVKARAAVHGREYAIPGDVKALARPVLAHRLVLSTDAELSGVTPQDVIADALQRVPAPSSDADPSGGSTTAVGDGGDVTPER